VIVAALRGLAGRSRWMDAPGTGDGGRGLCGFHAFPGIRGADIDLDAKVRSFTELAHVVAAIHAG
jgi:hypothetical protein